MGIPHLTTILKPYGQPCLLDGRTVVIDGPALAYHIIYICNRERPATGPITHPSCNVLARTAIAWLDNLRAHDVVIAAVYFDGYLPLEKRKVRLERFSRTTRDINNYYLSNPKGPPPPAHAVEASDSIPSLFPKPAAAASSLRLPPSAFAVQAIIEAIVHSDQYGKLSRLVPQEADPYCAAHVRQAGGTVLTSDSDLVLYDLGPKGSVAFFRDLEVGRLSGVDGILAVEYAPAALSQRLLLPPRYGMSALGFELYNGIFAPARALRDAAEASAISAVPEEYEAFMQPYRITPPSFSEECHGDTWKILRGSDSRISECVLQCHLDPDGIVRDRAAELPAVWMFLPQFYEDWLRPSAWATSLPLRQIAYGLVQLVPTAPLETVIEHRRLLSASSNGTSVPIPSLPSIRLMCNDLLSLLGEVRGKIGNTSLCWSVVSMYYDIIWAARERKESVALHVLQRDADSNGRINMTTWSVMHLLAQIQATCYSLRMIKQILDIVTDTAIQSIPACFLSLREQLTALPALTEMPSARDLEHLPSRMKDEGALDLLTELAGLPEPITFKARRKTKARKVQKEPNNGDSGHGHSSSSASRNPFAALDGM
ncbi:uncharacterized protein E0L32_004856 [Thyridium curvatum]|uniref:Asteroid domain-containing protein n=1 Tax=Thyridium curvatum TaxID=1093900 RepID=A0A507B7B6_9PEZI|nr:uncharacterized protein E0L32_004856 [Thyridium curvatum]TPX15026.1 hypothetical protein E0L32_004856 [Thyridium curvatum]